MQQLNVLPINVSKSVENKDDTSAQTSPSSKDDFSQHIDLHIAKNKDVNDIKNETSSQKNETKADVASSDKSNLKNESNVQDSSETSNNLKDENSAEGDTPEIAASGKKSEIESNKTETNEEHQVVNESELLMSFLTKADKTLIDENSVAVTNSDKASQEKSKEDLLLKTNSLMADASNETEEVALKSSDGEEEVTGKDKANNTSPNSSKSDKVSKGVQQLESDLASKVDESSNNVKTGEALGGDSDNSNRENNASQQSVTTKLSEKATEDTIIKNQKAVEPALNNKVQEETESDTLSKASGSVELESDRISKSVFEQQGINSKSNNIDSSKNSASSKSSTNSNIAPNAQNPFESESKINEQIAKLIQNEHSASKVESNPASAITASEHVNRNASTAYLSKTGAEASVKDKNSVVPNAQTEAKSIDAFIEQNKEFSSDDNNNIAVKELPKNNMDFSNNGAVIDTSSRSTQAFYNRIDQQSAEILNPIGSSEVSQSQKTNTQLHQETISIFRKDFADATKEKVMLMISQKLQRFDITLDPPELGNMQVRVNLQGEQATVNFVVQNQQAKDALEQNMHKLKDMLAEQGVDVGDSNVEQQSQQSDTEDNTGENQNNSNSKTADASDVIAHTLTARVHDSSSKVIDYYA
jgi:flagellar hook-length control protein FliK